MKVRKNGENFDLTNVTSEELSMLGVALDYVTQFMTANANTPESVARASKLTMFNTFFGNDVRRAIAAEEAKKQKRKK